MQILSVYSVYLKITTTNERDFNGFFKIHSVLYLYMLKRLVT